MAFLTGLIYFLGVPAAIAAAVAGVLANLCAGWSLRRRTVISALLAGFIPVLLPIAVVVSDSGGIDLWIPVVAISVLGLIMALVVGLPVSLWIGRRKQPADAGSRSDQVFD